MGYEAINNAIRTRFKTSVDDVIAETIGYDNAPFATPTDATHVYFTILPGAAEQRDMGGTTKGSRSVGVAVAQIFSLPNTGEERALEIADIIVAAFRCVTASGVEYLVPNLVRVGLVGGWYQLNVQIPFRADQSF